MIFLFSKKILNPFMAIRYLINFISIPLIKMFPSKSENIGTISTLNFQNSTRGRALKLIAEKYSIEQSYCVMSQITNAVEDRACNLKNVLKESLLNENDQNIKVYYSGKSEEKELRELCEYYKYYAQSSIIYHREFKDMMHRYRERKKLVEYDRIKIILNLSDSQVEYKQIIPESLFNILSSLDKSKKENQQSLLFERLKNKMQEHIGPSKNSSIIEIDRQFDFSKKNSRNGSIFPYKNKFLRSKNKQNLSNIFLQKKLAYKQRNNSCGSLDSAKSKRGSSKKRIIKRKHNSLQIIDLSSKEKEKMIGISNKESVNQSTVGKKIGDLKDRIRKQKEILKKKNIYRHKQTLSTNQSQICRNTKKTSRKTKVTYF